MAYGHGMEFNTMRPNTAEQRAGTWDHMRSNRKHTGRNIALAALGIGAIGFGLAPTLFEQAGVNVAGEVAAGETMTATETIANKVTTARNDVLTALDPNWAASDIGRNFATTTDLEAGLASTNEALAASEQALFTGGGGMEATNVQNLSAQQSRFEEAIAQRNPAETGPAPA